MKIDASLLKSIAKGSRLKEDRRGFSGVSTDTRQRMENGLFVPLKGERFDGHRFIEQAIEAGATGALWKEQEPVPEQLPETFQLYYVEDTLKALQALAQAYREKVNPFVIGITGSNGKTTTKDIVASVLAGTAAVHKTKGNLNNHIGVPLTLLAMPEDCTYAVVEMGMNHAGEISTLTQIAKPNAAIITSIGDAHIEHLGSREGIAAAKMEIADGLIKESWLLFDGDEPLLSPYNEQAETTVGFSDQAATKISDVKTLENGYVFYLNGARWQLTMLGKHNVKNAAYAILLAQKLGFSNAMIQKQLSSLAITGMRLEKLKGPNGSTIINDAYNANPTSMKAAIETVKELPHYKRRVLVLGDIYELGQDEEALHKSVATAIEPPITDVVTVGKKGRWIYEAQLDKKDSRISLVHADTVVEAAEILKPYYTKDTVVLIKASRGLALEEVLPAVKGGN
ncbi:UDP-N-acetylmuramoyl-tripeptide--D-alanyl-D-alanine ligase [Shouchella clausii]|uniref:UDP-N-acetylmuramoyl-tripeptide--D-alanyl-D-alanine ligase n=2 Tax=Shouchella clausii TaxID=79880 RepID=Q5WFG6_SHOC1|nr:MULTISPECIES: UDP-N-acetylmuramoyl-tripeptide--D-alanyl-D-alanine ligase [Shouchella]MCM3312288.1 UDP-N-acetylmuramoyl-tripeptide--D-alanyl-D-alanine ligase [Psychrobacillus sp. MER TA 17]ALA54741.1 UDP-N-acetylmuramoylalanyl-D-glutamyl-2,6-diaminopimelate--D-alanyl-D-alanine ligase [Shouchella clausii]KKI84598.1 UDP-N-acetylmuramoylalanyl-D-glutamate--2,6-diaminopimelate ligase [Shouchella clausii]MBU3230727.1 UDP-N-acetylmuramoyl-tripeptide--D-alanyl-D-alanine ligase [Shouchella clausii]M